VRSAPSTPTVIEPTEAAPRQSAWHSVLVWPAMKVEPVVCACGNPISGTGHDSLSVLFGPMCDSCVRMAHHKAGWLCDRCVRRVRAEHPGIEIGLDNMHPLAHSAVLDTCVDLAILPFLEGFNQDVAPTFSSCQGIDMLPGRPGRWVQEPYIVVDGEYQSAVTTWAKRNTGRYRISAVRVHDKGSPFHRVCVDFADTPTIWLD